MSDFASEHWSPDHDVALYFVALVKEMTGQQLQQIWVLNRRKSARHPEASVILASAARFCSLTLRRKISPPGVVVHGRHESLYVCSVISVYGESGPVRNPDEGHISQHGITLTAQRTE